jgi:hypothetical protein
VRDASRRATGGRFIGICDGINRGIRESYLSRPFHFPRHRSSGLRFSPDRQICIAIEIIPPDKPARPPHAINRNSSQFAEDHELLEDQG